MTGTILETSDLIAAVLADRELTHHRVKDNEFVVELPGEKRLVTTTMVTVGNHGVRLEAFVCRRPDENAEGVHRFLLRRNRRLYGMAYTIDKIGDIYLVGRLATESVTGDELDRLLGQILEASDGDFNTLLELGFAESIRREWKWRVSRGEPLTNLKAFEHLVNGSDADNPWLPQVGKRPADDGPSEDE